MGKKLSASEIDGVQYRRAKLWQIILYACNAFVGMTVYSLIGMASYAASIGFGIGTAAIGVILTGTRILDGVTDPMLAFLYDKVNTKYGKIRILLIVGFVIEAVALLCMYDWAAGKGLGTVAFVLFYVIYVIGYTINPSVSCSCLKFSYRTPFCIKPINDISILLTIYQISVKKEKS